MKYKCQNCGCTFLSDYIYCPQCSEYTSASGMIQVPGDEDEEDDEED